MLTPLRMIPVEKERVWGGSRLRPPRALPIGEVWAASPWSIVASGAWSGTRLEDVAAAGGAELLGTAMPDRRSAAVPGAGGPSFPLLVKLLDPAAWLSVQVHPDDAVARRLEGPDSVGKAEAWFVVDAEPGAELLVGLREGVTIAAARTAIGLPAAERGTAVVDLMARIEVRRGDAILLPPGTLHAVGPGVLLYEVQQPSDLTYRVDDWGRPATPGRGLHVAQAIASIGVGDPPEVRRAAPAGRVLGCPWFTLDLVAAAATLRPAGRSLHVVTALDSPAELEGAGWTERLQPLETVVVPAATDAYDVRPGRAGRVLVAGLP